MKKLTSLIFNTCVAIVGYTIHSSIFWTIIDFFFAPIALIKWLIFHEINFTIIKEAFNFLNQ